MTEDLDTAAVGRRLELIRRQLGLGTQAHFAARLGVGTNRYNHWATGKILIPVQIAAQIAAMAGVSLDYIYLGDVSGVKVGVLNTLSAARPRT